MRTASLVTITIHIYNPFSFSGTSLISHQPCALLQIPLPTVLERNLKVRKILLLRPFYRPSASFIFKTISSLSNIDHHTGILITRDLKLGPFGPRSIASKLDILSEHRVTHLESHLHALSYIPWPYRSYISQYNHHNGFRSIVDSCQVPQGTILSPYRRRTDASDPLSPSAGIYHQYPSQLELFSLHSRETVQQ